MTLTIFGGSIPQLMMNVMRGPLVNALLKKQVGELDLCKQLAIPKQLEKNITSSASFGNKSYYPCGRGNDTTSDA